MDARTNGTGDDPGTVEEAAFDHRSVADLAMDALGDVTTLVQDELHLARAELRQNLREALNGIVQLALATATVMAGAAAFLVALGFGLAAWFGLALWIGLGLASLLGLLVGVVLLVSARKALDPHSLAPSRIADSLQRDAELARKRM